MGFRLVLKSVTLPEWLWTA